MESRTFFVFVLSMFESFTMVNSNFLLFFSTSNEQISQEMEEYIGKTGIISSFLLLVIVPLIGYIIWTLLNRLKSKVPFRAQKKAAHFRFRNRDKIRFYAIRLSRKFNAIASQLNELKSREEKQQYIIDFVKRCLKRESDGRDPLLLQRTLPESFFEPEPDEQSDMPEDFKLMLSRVRILSYLGRKVIAGLVDKIKTINLNAGNYLFRIGDPEENIFIVKSGKIDLKIKDNDGIETIVHEVTTGGNPYSLLAIIDVMTNQKCTYHNVHAVATTKSTVISLSIPDLLQVCRQFPPANLRLAQMISVRVHRVTFAALHNFFGLGAELFSQEPQTFLQQSAVKSYLSQYSESNQPTVDSTLDDEPVYQQYMLKENRAVEPQLLPVGAAITDHLIPPASDIKELQEEASLDEVSGSIGVGSTTSLPAAVLLELGEVALPELGPGTMKTVTTSSSIPIVNDNNENVDVISTSFLQNENVFGVTGTQRRLVPTRKPGSSFYQEDKNESLVAASQQDLARLFGLSDPVVLNGMVNVVEVNMGNLLSKELELQAELYYIITGRLHVIQTVVISSQAENPPKTGTILVCNPGELIGLMGVITGEPNNSSIQVACKGTKLAVIARENFFLLIRSHPQVLVNATHLMSLRLSPLLRQADFALEWLAVDAGKALYKQGDRSSYIYVVLNGRFREVHTYDNGNRHVVGESGRGAFIGFVEVSSAKPRVSTVLAIRDSEVVQIPSILLNWLKRLTPHPINRFIQLLSDRLMQPASSAPSMHSMISLRSQFGQPVVNIAGSGPLNSQVADKEEANEIFGAARLTGGAMSNLKAIAIVPATPEINAEAFCLELQHAMSVFGSSVRLTADIILKRVGANALEPANEYRLSSWLNHQEDLHRIIFYVGDAHRSSGWTRRCLRQADCVMVLALADSTDPSKPSILELAMNRFSTKVTKVLVLMHPLETESPRTKETAAWLNARPWINQHYHIRCPPRVLSPSSRNLVAFYSRVFASEEPNPHSDMSRLARCLTGQAVGLVLGGGGAKGGAHVGIIRAFQEAGIPIDMVGGTSIGALIGAMWAEQTKVAQLIQKSRDFAMIFSSIWPKLRDLTYPTVSIFSGHEFNVHIEATFKDRQIEDLWLPYFCVTTDISNCKMRVHTNGCLWRYARSSMSYPLLFPPLCDPKDGQLLMDGAFVNNLPGSLWRYVRSSMSLASYMPPLCDPCDGSYLLDGGYVNNVPADIMSSFGAKTIYAVDVGSVYDTNLTNYGDWLSGWWLIYQRFFRWWGPQIRVPNLTEIQSRLAYISCIRHLEEVKASGICHYLRPPIDKFMTLQFSAFEEIVSVGFKYARDVLTTWQANGLLQRMMPGTYARKAALAVDANRPATKIRSSSIGPETQASLEIEPSEAAHRTIRRRRVSLVESPPKIESGACQQLMPDFDDEWAATVLRLQPERLCSLELGSSAILPEAREGKRNLPLAEHWLYSASSVRPTPSVTPVSTMNRSGRLRRRTSPSLILKSTYVDDIISTTATRLLQKQTMTSYEKRQQSHRSAIVDETGYDEDSEPGNYESLLFDDDDEPLMTASDPELSCIRFVEKLAMNITQDDMLSNVGRFKSHVSNLRIPRLTDSHEDLLLEGKANLLGQSKAPPLSPYRHHRLHRRSSLNKIRRQNISLDCHNLPETSN